LPPARPEITFAPLLLQRVWFVGDFRRMVRTSRQVGPLEPADEMALMQGAHGHWQKWGLFPEPVRAGRTQADRALGSSMFDYLAQHPGEAALFSQAVAQLREESAAWRHLALPTDHDGTTATA
jgi:hypothetical protein